MKFVCGEVETSVPVHTYGLVESAVNLTVASDAVERAVAPAQARPYVAGLSILHCACEDKAMFAAHVAATSSANE